MSNTLISYAADETVDVYSIKLTNETSKPVTFFLYQTFPEQPESVHSLVWFASPFLLTHGNRITFQWQTVANFVWGASGPLTPDTTFQAGGVIDASSPDANETTFNVQPGPHLSQPVAGDLPEIYRVTGATDVPENIYSAGVGMSGSGTFVTQASPNRYCDFPANVDYYVGAAIDARVGGLVNAKDTTVAQAKFPVNIVHLNATLQDDGFWRITPGFD